ncbi:MAG TPA: hypothetical protein VGO97_03765, partial [Solirubrobacterales bacterium]|nr:hypothetical protein [Solirubrobacterales bacterium]
MAIEAGVPAVDGDKPAASGAPASGFFGRIQSILEGVARRLENPKVEYALWGGLLLALIAFVVIRPIYPNYDTMYALVWGDQIAHGHLPDYSVFKTPTPHPLFNVYTAILSLTGNAAIWILLGLSLLMYVGLLMGVYRLVQMKIGTLVAAVTVVVLLTRTDLMAFAFRSMLDIPFLALIVWAAVLELKKPRRGTAPLVLLMLAGLLRPEAWLLAGLYWLWLAAGVVKPQLQLPGETPSHGKLAGYAGLVVAAPVIWLGCDWIVTGDPMYSLTSTRQVAGELGRQKSLGKSITLLPHYSGGSEHIVNPYVGFLGFAFAAYLLRSR